MFVFNTVGERNVTSTSKNHYNCEYDLKKKFNVHSL